MIIVKMTWEKKSGARDMSAEGERRMSYYRDREEWLLFLGPSPLLHPWKWDNANLEKYVREILERNTKGECHITERRLITFSGTIARHPALQYLHGTETACSQSFNFTSFILQVICETFPPQCIFKRPAWELMWIRALSILLPLQICSGRTSGDRIYRDPVDFILFQ